MSLKDNFNQAVKEILRKDGLVGEELSKESKRKSELDKYIDPPKPAETFEQTVSEQPSDIIPEPDYSAAAEVQEPVYRPQEPQRAPESASASNPFAQNASQQASPFGTRQPYENQSAGGPRGAFAPQGSPGQYSQQQGGNPDPFSRQGNSYGGGAGFGGGAAYGGGAGYGGNAGYGGAPYGNAGGGYGGGGVPPVPPMNNGGPFIGGSPDTPYYETEETTVISRNTIVNGSIRSFANVNVDGSIKGDVKITKNINVTGKIVGDIECNNSVMAGASMQGNVASKGQVQIDRDTILLGDVAAQYLDLNGKVKGNLDIGGKAEFKTDAVVLGNITASTITVLDGATIQGYVNTTFLQESSSSIFPEAIAVTE